MLYELIGIARVTSSNANTLTSEAKEVVSSIGKLIINNRGVVRKIYNLGVKPLPKIITSHQERNFRGARFMMVFDSSAPVQTEILRALRRDHRVIRSAIMKVDDKSKLNVLGAIERIKL